MQYRCTRHLTRELQKAGVSFAGQCSRHLILRHLYRLAYRRDLPHAPKSLLARRERRVFSRGDSRRSCMTPTCRSADFCEKSRAGKERGCSQETHLQSCPSQGPVWCSRGRGAATWSRLVRARGLDSARNGNLQRQHVGNGAGRLIYRRGASVHSGRARAIARPAARDKGID